MSEPVYIVSVVRDYAMYGKCIADNPNCADCQLVTLDNLKDNKGIPTCYNSFIDALPSQEGWVVFCHEDWQPLQPLMPLLDGLDRHCLYGPVGTFLEVCPHADFIHITGRIRQCRKDGSHVRRLKGTWKDNRTDTFDCQCLIVHSTLLKEKGLRFDEQLSFDLYTEDFCAAAHLAGIPSRILPIACCHYSGGTLTERFWKGLDYLRSKYATCEKRFPTPVNRRNSFGGAQDKPIYNYRRTLWARLRYRLKK